jgi:hypothetical protein
MDKSFKQQESNSVLSSDGVDEVEGTPVLQATGESTGQKSHQRTWWTLSNVSVAALALAMSFGFGVATGEVAGASVIGRPVAPAAAHKPGRVQAQIGSQNIQKAMLVSYTYKPETLPQHGGWCGPQNGHWNIIHRANPGNENVGLSPQHGGWSSPQHMRNNNPQNSQWHSPQGGHWNSPQNGHWG